MGKPYSYKKVEDSTDFYQQMPQGRMQVLCLKPFMATLKPQSNGPLYTNTVIGTLTVDGRAVTFGTVRKGLGGLGPHPVPSWLYQM